MRRVTALGLTIVMVALWGVAGSGVRGQDAGAEDMSEYLPPGAGKAKVLSACTACHELNRIVPLRKSTQAWKDLVAQMIKEQGAEFSEATVESVTAYLGEALGPDAPPLTDVNTATPEELVKLPGVTPTLADRLISHRQANGLFGSRGEVRLVLGLDEPSFEKAKWYLRVAKEPLRK